MQYGVLLHKIRRRLRRGRFLSRCLVAALALAFLGASVRILPSAPLIARLMGRATGEAYPCAGGACGCGSAHECWTTCQCQSMAEKIAWAQDRGIAIPEYADHSRLAYETLAQPACPLCESHADGAPTPETPRGAPTMSALGCKGLQSLIAVGLASTMLNPPPTTPQWRPSRELIEIRSERAPTRSLDAPIPPPRRA
ncbi:MAG: hypothetical protein R3B57_02930 [Phycisphaerales bacterium]